MEHTARCRLTFNRIPKDDLRRRFPFMLCNVLNQGNSELTHALLSRYFTPDCDIFGDPMPQYWPSYLHLKGPNQFAHHIELANSPLPDFVYTIIGVRVIRRFYEELSIVEIYFNLKATRLVCSYSPPPHYQNTYYMVPVSDPYEMTEEEVNVKIKASFYMNRKGEIVKAIGCNTDSVPTRFCTAILSAH
eukprot:scaffold998_cov162-Ochromonas_danica.AAC.17